MHWFEFAKDLEKLICHFLVLLLHRFADVMRCFLINTPLDASWFRCPPPNPAGDLVPAMVGGKCTVCSGSRASPLHAWPPWVCYQLSSGILNTGSWWVFSGSRCLQDSFGCPATPGLDLGQNFVGMYPHPASITLAPLAHGGVYRGPRWVQCHCHI